MNKQSEKSTILIVDDTPDNLSLLNDMLKETYRIKLALNGKQALSIIEKSPPDLVLLDIMMPEMNGYEVCHKIKESPACKDIPIIFISALSDTSNIVKGFHSGGADYVTKPFHFEEVTARIQTQLKISHSKNEIQNLLSKTLTGSIRVMLDVLALTHPALFAQSNRLRKYARGIISQLGFTQDESWMLELAVMLSTIGCVTIPPHLQQKYLLGQKMTLSEATTFETHASIGAELIERIPRLEKVASIIRNQFLPLEQLSLNDDDLLSTGSLLLRILVFYDMLIYSSEKPPSVALQIVSDHFYKYSPKLLSALSNLDTSNIDYAHRTLPLLQLEAGMILNQHLLATDGSILLDKGSELTDNLLNLIFHFQKLGKCPNEPVNILQK